MEEESWKEDHEEESMEEQLLRNHQGQTMEEASWRDESLREES